MAGSQRSLMYLFSEAKVGFISETLRPRVVLNI